MTYSIHRVLSCKIFTITIYSDKFAANCFGLSKISIIMCKPKQSLLYSSHQYLQTKAVIIYLPGELATFVRFCEESVTVYVTLVTMSVSLGLIAQS